MKDFNRWNELEKKIDEKNNIRCKIWLYRLTVRTSAFQAGNPGSIPGRVTKRAKPINCFICEPFVKAQTYTASLREVEPGSASTYIFYDFKK